MRDVVLAAFSGAALAAGMVSATTEQQPVPGMMPFGQAGVLQSGPSGIEVVVPEAGGQFRTQKLPDVNTSMAALEESSKQMAGTAAAPQPIVCQCNCPPCEAAGKAALPTEEDMASAAADADRKARLREEDRALERSREADRRQERDRARVTEPGQPAQPAGNATATPRDRTG